MPKATSPLAVALAYDGLCTFEFGVAVEVFGLPRPELGPDWYRFAVAALDPGPLRAMGGIRVEADGGLDLLDQADIIVIPGWRGATEPVPDALIAALRQAASRGACLLSICSGAFVLAAAGLLNGRQATTHWRYATMLADLYPDIQVVPDVLYVDEGNIMTSAGSAAGIDLCLHLVRRDFGPEAANSVARRLVVQPHREGGQAQFIEAPVPIAREGARLAPLLDHLRDSLAEDHSLSSMASKAGMSLRTFLRRFQAMTGTTPGEWLLTERLSRVRELLECSSLPVEEVATLTGFGSAATLRHHFRQRLGLSPASYRARFRRTSLPEQATAKKGAVVADHAQISER
ncbi:transcriptional regulator [Azospirillum sp. TSH100]|uniref:transcriptional regulator FtrA n=1 Tax=Azospirillum sp. TSH100 TaxID=652764 RepID=UPI000D611D65|nr:transcriptional regulator FtrA [Azospirillum sp. TSH100]PWC87770.1 transcriptional regulator [Azospirillum sp. TSH100]QCG88708.1 transcriptional regulator FtrA [Azospirillum sp. TSH100]